MPLLHVVGKDCPVCAEPLNGGRTTTTLVGYMSPPGHNHDDNCINRWYSCINGHVFEVSKINSCHACDWVGEKECFCCPNGKQHQWPEDT